MKCFHIQGLFSVNMYWNYFEDLDNKHCWWPSLVNMFIIIIKMHIGDGLFCKHVYYHHKNVPFRIKIWITMLPHVCWRWFCRSTVPPPTSAFTVYKTPILRKNICLSLKSASVSTHQMKNQSILISLLPHVSCSILYLLYMV